MLRPGRVHVWQWYLVALNEAILSGHVKKRIITYHRNS